MWTSLKVEGENIDGILRLEPTTHKSLLDAFIGSKQVRFGPRPDDEGCEYIQSILNLVTAEGRPIEVLTIWGATKGYLRTPSQRADFLDLMALKRLAALQTSIQQFYTPGIRFTIVWEDFTEYMLRNYEGMEYHDTFVAMTKAMGLDFINVVKESRLLPEGDYKAAIYDNALALVRDDYASVGWKGTIDWDFYIPRAAIEHPDMNHKRLRFQVALYLGISLARYQFKCIPRHDIKFSFCPYPKTVPCSMRKGRIEYKVKPSKDCKKTAAPWTSFGLLRESDWTYVSVNDLENIRTRPTTLRVNGIDIPTLRLFE